MSLYFRKSLRLGGGVRMNLSKSGIGFSLGTRGARVSTGTRGTYINMGTNGIHYRQKIGEPLDQPTPASSPGQPALTYQTGTPIPTANAEHLVDTNSAANLARLNATIKQPVYAWTFILGGFVLAGILAIVHILSFFLVLGFAFYLALIAQQWDKDRRTYRLEYTLDEAARQPWIVMNTAFHTLAQAQKIWRITTHDDTDDWKRNAGASSLMNRINATLAQRPATYIASNLTPYCLHIGIQQLYFYPDRMYVYQNGIYGAVEYESLNINTGHTRFIETDGAPTDAEIVGSTWEYVNKNGSPDRRFNNNRQLPITNYGEVEMKAVSGLNLILHISSLKVCRQFGSLYQQSRHATTRPAHQQNRAQQAPPRTQQRHSSPPPPFHPIIECYQVLGLLHNCTKEEASAKYWQLASSYHPDRVNHLAPEFKALAHQKMTEINNAFTELKRLQSW